MQFRDHASETPMCIVVIGGMDRLAPHYQEEAKRLGIRLRVFPRVEKSTPRKLGGCDGVVLFTNMISHAGRRVVLDAIRRHNIPLYQLHACGLCTLRDCLRCLLEGATGNQCAKNQRPPSNSTAQG